MVKLYKKKKKLNDIRTIYERAVSTTRINTGILELI